MSIGVEHSTSVTEEKKRCAKTIHRGATQGSFGRKIGDPAYPKKHVSRNPETRFV